jgi:hypothetical protein
METVLFVGMKITPFVVFWSTMTIIELKPSLSGRSVIKSVVTTAKGHVVVDLIRDRGGTVR